MDIKEQSLKALEYDKVISILSGFAKTKQSKALCLKLTPETNRQIIEQNLQYTDEARRILDLALDIPIEYVISLDEVKLNSEYFAEDELIDFAKTLRTSRLVKSFLRENAESDALLNILASFCKQRFGR